MENSYMTMERTELEWSYQPPDFFEAPYTSASPDCSLQIDGGTALATLRPAQNPLDATVEHRIEDYLRSVFLARNLQIRREFYLAERAMVHQYDAAGGKGVEIRVPAATATVRAGQPEFTITNADGIVIRDSKAERIAEHTSMLDMVASKAAQSPTLRRMLQSHSDSVSDSDNELVRLYEIRDALKVHYGGETKARDALGITEPEWERLGRLANDPHISQGRHRGGKQLTGTRSATADELQDVRTLAFNWIIAFARTL
jgi:hypothetical protein